MSEIQDNECVICFEIIGEKNNCVTECGHKFCLKCLIVALSHKNSCPCCRNQLIEDDDEYEESVDEGESSNEDDESVDDEAHIEDVVDRLNSQGITFIDVVSMLLNRYSKKDEKYTNEFIYDLTNKFDRITAEADAEYIEQMQFSREDKTNVISGI